jgi:hypothetical protein
MSIVEDEIIDFFKKEIDSSNISQRLLAVRNCEYVADCLCSTSVKNVLLPLINGTKLNMILEYQCYSTRLS